VLTPDIARRLEQLIREKAQALEIDVLSLTIMPDHIHLFIAASPTDAVQHFVNQFKGYASRMLRQEYPMLKSRLPCLWSRSYYVGTAGHVSAETITRYIENQRGR